MLLKDNIQRLSLLNGLKILSKNYPIKEILQQIAVETIDIRKVYKLLGTIYTFKQFIRCWYWIYQGMLSLKLLLY